MASHLSIFGRRIGIDQPVLVIAEIGVNHDGRLDRAMQLVEAAHAARADAVKLQVFSASTLMNSCAAFATYQLENCRESSPADMLRRYELPPEQIETIVEAIRDRNMLPLATPFSPGDVSLLQALRLPAIKIASPDLVNKPLLRRAAQLGRPLLVSTGAATMLEIEQAARWLGEFHVPYALLHCISAYPTPDYDANLCWVTELAARFDVPIGYSDHTTELLSGALACAAGASIIEKHLTYDRGAPGPDHAASADPEQFAHYVKLIRQAQRLRGRGGRHVLAIEEDVRRVSRQSLVLARGLSPGDILRAEDLIVQRPGTGVPAAEFDSVVGRKLAQPAPAGTMLRWEMIA